jgi:hypothetical protein
MNLPLNCLSLRQLKKFDNELQLQQSTLREEIDNISYIREDIRLEIMKRMEKTKCQP